MTPHTISLPRIRNSKGGLGVIEKLPFEIKRVYYLYDTPCGVKRGGHAHRELAQVMIALSGSFVITVVDGTGTTHVFPVDGKSYGIYIPPMCWRVLTQFSPGAICLVLASTEYDPQDYIYDYDEFMKEANGGLANCMS
jgi:dTDP-4-dehydrorhamnose 3,5-epimerase-like enzyme